MYCYAVVLSPKKFQIVQDLSSRKIYKQYLKKVIGGSYSFLITVIPDPFGEVSHFI